MLCWCTTRRHSKDRKYISGQKLYLQHCCIYAATHRITETRPGVSAPKKTKKGWAARQGLQIWNVGVRIGATIREYLQKTGQDECASGRTLRPHIRRAHWHGYWTGPRNDPEHKKYIHKWIPAIPVNVTPADNGELPAVVRNIK